MDYLDGLAKALCIVVAVIILAAFALGFLISWLFF